MDYDKIKDEKDSAASKMASYSDLFMVLSIVFLLLYVVSSIRNGVYSVYKQGELKEMAAEAKDLKQQIKVYNTLKENVVKESTTEEQKVYEELMDKLTLLQEQSKNEKENLRKKALENEQKEMALNQYQQIVRNIINANMLAKDRIARRDDNIQVKRKTIKEQKEDIKVKKVVIENQVNDIKEKKTLIAEKENIISDNKKVIDRKSKQITVLKDDVEEKRRSIEVNSEDIQSLNNSLKRKVADLNQAYKRNKTTKRKMQSAISKLKKSTANQIAQIKGKTQEVQKELKNINQELTLANSQLTVANDTIDVQNQKKQMLDVELKKINEEYKQTQQEHKIAYQNLKQQHADQYQQLQKDHSEKMAKEKADFDSNMKALKLSATAKASRLAAFNKRVAGEKASLNAKLSSLTSEMEATGRDLASAKNARDKALADAEAANIGAGKARAAALADIEAQKNAYNAKIAKARKDFLRQLEKQKLSAAARAKKMREFKARVKKEKVQLNQRITNIRGKNVELTDDLKKAQEIINAKKKLAKMIQDNFRKAGILAEVDPNSGDVILSFGNDYFSTGQSRLKRSMQSTLKKFMPSYSKSLFSDPKIAEKISGVEIVGFSSPTYRGKYVDPKSLNTSDRAAVSYNLDLSFQRAKSIFTYIFNTDKMKYQYQKRLLPIVKVTGRSF